MKRIALIISFLAFTYCFGQEPTVWIKDKNGKVIATTTEKRLRVVVDSLGYRAKYTSRWIDGVSKDCLIRRRDELIKRI